MFGGLVESGMKTYALSTDLGWEGGADLGDAYTRGTPVKLGMSARGRDVPVLKRTFRELRIFLQTYQNPERIFFPIKLDDLYPFR